MGFSGVLELTALTVGLFQSGVFCIFLDTASPKTEHSRAVEFQRRRPRGFSGTEGLPLEVLESLKDLLGLGYG